tara:strand:- start:641 stop:1111 length:471 start_codon:yes stop_codon:yes gene_type:complete
MSKTIRVILALCLVVAALFGEKIVEVVKNNVEIVNTPSVGIPEPDLAYRTLVNPIVAIDIDSKDAKQISDFFVTLSDVVENDPGFISSTSTFKRFNETSGGLNFAGLNLKDKYPTLGEKIDMCIKSSIGLEDTSLNKEKRENLCLCLDAIAWGVHK